MPSLQLEPGFCGTADTTPGLRPNPTFSHANSPVSPVDRLRLLTALFNMGCRAILVQNCITKTVLLEDAVVSNQADSLNLIDPQRHVRGRCQPFRRKNEKSIGRSWVWRARNDVADQEFRPSKTLFRVASESLFTGARNPYSFDRNTQSVRAHEVLAQCVRRGG